MQVLGEVELRGEARALGEADVPAVHGDLGEALHTVQAQDDPLALGIEGVDLDGALVDGGGSRGRDTGRIHREGVGLVGVGRGAVAVELPHVRHLDLVPIAVELGVERGLDAQRSVEEPELPRAGERAEAERAVTVHRGGCDCVGVAEEVGPCGQAPLTRS